MALFAMIFIAWFSFLIDFYMGFHLAVSYGRTRKNFLLSVIPVYAAYGFLFMAEVRLLAELERIILELTGIVQVPKWFHSNYISPGWLFLYAVLLTGNCSKYWDSGLPVQGKRNCGDCCAFLLTSFNGKSRMACRRYLRKNFATCFFCFAGLESWAAGRDFTDSRSTFMCNSLCRT